MQSMTKFAMKSSSKQPCWVRSTKAHLKNTYIIPLEMGGTDDDPDNVVPLCDQCHTFIERWKLENADNTLNHQNQ
jgi:hypothetical protein